MLKHRLISGENVKPYSIVSITYPAEDADLVAMDRFDTTSI